MMLLGSQLIENRTLTQRKKINNIQKIGQSVNLDNEYDPKAFRLAMHTFLNNLYKYYGKAHKDCLGDLEEWYKLPITKEEKEILSANMQKIVMKSIDKLSRENINRNAHIQQSIKEYTEAYSQTTSSIKLQKSAKTADIDIPNKSDSNILFSKKVIKESDARLKSESIGRRMFTRGASRVQNQGAAFMNNQMMQKDDDQYCFIFNKDNIKRNVKTRGISSNSCRQEHFQFTVQTSKKMNSTSEIQPVHRESIRSNNEQDRQSDRKAMERGRVDYLMKFWRYDMSEVKKNREEIEKLKIQNRIAMANDALPTNTTTYQGYKPKSKCWGFRTCSGSGKKIPKSSPIVVLK